MRRDGNRTAPIKAAPQLCLPRPTLCSRGKKNISSSARGNFSQKPFTSARHCLHIEYEHLVTTKYTLIAVNQEFFKYFLTYVEHGANLSSSMYPGTIKYILVCLHYCQLFICRGNKKVQRYSVKIYLFEYECSSIDIIACVLE